MPFEMDIENEESSLGQDFEVAPLNYISDKSPDPAHAPQPALKIEPATPEQN